MSAKKNKKDKNLKNVVRDIASLGLGAVLETEKLLRQKTGEYTFKQTEIFFKQLAKQLVDEVKNLLRDADLSEQLTDFLDNYEAKINLKISFKKKK